MKNVFLCTECIKINNRNKNQTELIPGVATLKSINDNGVYKITCVNSHTAYYLDTSFKFQNLFISGCFALIDGYYREAATSFAISLERFYGSAVNCFVVNKNIDENELNNSWSNIKRQSERQLGAFLYLYLSEFKTTPKLLSNNMTKLRNDITHYGYIPTEDETIKFGNAIVNLQREVINKTCDSDVGFWSKEHARELKEKKKLMPEDTQFVTLGTMFTLNSPVFRDKLSNEIDLKNELDLIRKTKMAIETIE